MDENIKITPVTVGAIAGAMTLVKAKVVDNASSLERAQLLVDVLDKNDPAYVISAMLDLFEDLIATVKGSPEVSYERIIDQYYQYAMDMAPTSPEPKKSAKHSKDRRARIEIILCECDD